jgi:poly(3-hydroxybutyrate) depolymerase
MVMTAVVGLAAFVTLNLCAAPAGAQPGQGRGGGGFGIDPRAQDRTYHFADTDEDLPYCVFASSKISRNTPAPLIISLHGLGAGPQIMCNSTAVDLAEDGGYILAAPMGYNVGGWYGSPVMRFEGRGRGGRGGDGQAARGRGGRGDGQAAEGRGGRGRGFNVGEQPENLAELSEKDVMNVLAMVREEFNVDPDRIYLTGHSMGGAGTLFLGSKHADIWAAIAPVAPAAFSMTENRVEILERLNDADVPVMVVHGDEDEAVPVDLARTWAATMDEIGMDHEYVELPGITHGPVITVSQEHVYEFFGKHSK